MKKKHKKKYGVYYSDTVDNTTFLQYQNNSIDACVAWIEFNYKRRLRPNGEDMVEIADLGGDIMRKFNVGKLITWK
jgi:hypothetical protein